MPSLLRVIIVFVAAAAVLFAGAAAAQDSNSKYLAPGFHARPAGTRLLIVPAEMELFSISAGGLEEPKADWTEAAQRNFKTALESRRDQLGPDTIELKEAELDDLAEINALQRAVAEAVFVHHTGFGMKLPTKNGRLDWTLGDAIRPLKEKTGADFALFTWIRDSYASNERKATMIALALIGAISAGGYQSGYACLVDLNTGRVVWFNALRRMSGDLRDEKSAMETVETLLKGFPAFQ